METMRIIFVILTIFLSINFALAEGVQTQSSQEIPITQAQNVSFENCTKMFAINKEKLFYLTLGGVTANKFVVEEIQTESGYIVFVAANNKYLATISGIDSANSILKITPCNDIYFFPPGVLINMFKYIDLNLNTEIKWPNN